MYGIGLCRSQKCGLGLFRSQNCGLGFEAEIPLALAPAGDTSMALPKAKVLSWSDKHDAIRVLYASCGRPDFKRLISAVCCMSVCSDGQGPLHWAEGPALSRESEAEVQKEEKTEIEEEKREDQGEKEMLPWCHSKKRLLNPQVSGLSSRARALLALEMYHTQKASSQFGCGLPLTDSP